MFRTSGPRIMSRCSEPRFWILTGGEILTSLRISVNLVQVAPPISASLYCNPTSLLELLDHLAYSAGFDLRLTMIFNSFGYRLQSREADFVFSLKRGQCRIYLQFLPGHLGNRSKRNLCPYYANVWIVTHHYLTRDVLRNKRRTSARC